MAAPTVDYIGTSNFGDDAAGESLAVTWSAGDRFLVIGGTENNNRDFTGVPALAGFTFSALTPDSGANPTNTASSCKGYVWSSDAAAGGGAGSITISGAAFAKAIHVFRFSGSDGIGRVVTAVSTALTVSLGLREGDNSAVVGGLFDWDATADVALTSSPAGGTVHFAQQRSGRYSAAVIGWGDQGAAGTTSYGAAADWTGTGTITKIVVEILGTTGGGTPVVASRGLSYDVANAVQAPRGLSYDVQAAVSATRALNYDVLNAVLASRGLSYDVLSALAVSRALSYDLLAAVQAPRTLNYDVIGAVLASRNLVYDVGEVVIPDGAVRAGLWYW